MSHKLTWVSSDTAIATVDAEGKITAVKAGETTVTVTTESGKSASLKVTVLQPATAIKLDIEDAQLEVGDSQQLTATILPDDSTDTELVWSSSDESIVSVDGNGLITALTLGEVVITVSVKNNPDVKAVCHVDVIPTLATEIYLDKTSVITKEGEEFDLTATVLPDDTTDKTVAWSSSDESIATVDDNGHVTIVGYGECYITASTTDGSNLSARCDITSESGIGVGVSAIWSDTTTRVDVYNLNGQLLIKDADCDDFRRLLPGIYIAAGRKVIKR